MRVRPGILLPLSAMLLALAAGCGEGGDGEPRADEPFTAEVRTARVAGTEIAWYDRGEGPPLLMLIGTGSTMAEWDPALLRLLAREQRVILFDYPGVGLSGPWRGRSFDSLADATARLMDAIDVPEAMILGWSMGGFVAQRLAIRHPERVSSLVLAGTTPGGRQTVLGTRRAQAIDSNPDPSDAEVLRLLYPPDHRGRTEGRSFLRRLVEASEDGEIPDDFEVPPATTNAQVAAEGPWLQSNENYKQLAAIGVPTLVTAGRSDPVTPPANTRRIASRIPDAELAVLPGAHAFLFQERAAFAALVAQLVRSQR